MVVNNELLSDSPLSRFLAWECSGGVLLCAAAILALVVANSPLFVFYQYFVDIPIEVRVGSLEIAKPILLWINDGLMAVFFFVIGLELKREWMEGELSDRSKIILPAVGALGGMAIPALIYYLFNRHDPVALDGWAIPAATDIAFSLGVLALLGSRVPASLKVFLVSLAIFDDVGAIIIIAIFYTTKISFTALVAVALCVPVLFLLNRKNVVLKLPYGLIGVVLWVATLKSGVHATLAGVLLALFIPMRSDTKPEISPVKSLENNLHSFVTFFVLPVFAFANAGVNLTNLTMDQIFHSVSIGVVAGLFLGKQIGIFSFCWLAVKLRWVSLSNGMNWANLYGVAVLCGIGFTMSLFIGSLAFDTSNGAMPFDERVGIIVGSLLSGSLGYFILLKSSKAEAADS